MRQHNIENYFFLDLSFPYLVKTMKRGCRNIAVRFSEYEAIETALAMQNKVEWVWIDCFTHLPLTSDSYRKLKEASFKLCLVSPELVSGDQSLIVATQSFLKEKRFAIDAVCTKCPDLWIPH